MPIKNDWVDGVDTVDAAAMNAIGDLANANETALGTKADKATTISAGTGLTGGGSLAANRTLAVAYGSTAGTAAQGNDSRLSDTRTPTDNTVSTVKLQNDSVTASKLAMPTNESVSSSATPTPAVTSQFHHYSLTALAAGATFGAPTGSPANGWRLMLRIKDNGTARALAFNAVFRAIGVTLPTTTTASKTHYIGCMWNSADSKWDVIAVGKEA